ncbi:MAG: RimK/LysX family protein [Cyanobacteria bacterium]|nr:RimK/LysX family protein [Cyanobacteriota bacterium]MDA1020328.1 RimK/LysX family protein [Cyanobacteriota bacterium]
MPKNKNKILIGRKEEIDLPDLKLKKLNAKVDTGAYTSSIHCHLIETYTRAGKVLLRFRLLDPEHPNYQRKTFIFRNFSSIRVKSSNGRSELRYQISTKVKINEEIFKTEFTLTDRSDMKYPILLGRKFIKQGFIVDVSKYNLAKKKYKINITKDK